jgi:hypothetical protein
MNYFRYFLLLMLMASGSALAADPGDLYRGRTLVTGVRDDTRIPAMSPCLLDVLAKVSGDARLLNDPAAQKVAASQAGIFALEFSYRDRLAGRQIHDEQGSRDRPYYLTVTFDPQKVDAALKALNSKPWEGKRPGLALFLAVNNSNNIYVLSGDSAFGRDQRESLAAASWQTGMPVTLPNDADLAKEGLTADVLSGVMPAKLDMVTNGMGADLVLFGSLVWNRGALGWAAEWKLFDGKEMHRWTIKGVNFDDAFRNALRGSALILSGSGEPG